MVKYRKTQHVEAEQFFPDQQPWPKGVIEEGGYFVDTLEGRLRVSPGDWIVTGARGERHPVKPDIFRETYEPVEDNS